MTPPTTIDARSEQMLELLAQGASARIVARKLGYSEGTMRVYLHKLYKAIGVRNKTEAVIWHLDRIRGQQAPAPTEQGLAKSEDCFGEMALAENLYAALGVMSSFLGPYGHMWEAGVRLKGGSFDDKVLARRSQSRKLWCALLKGDFAYGKSLHDDDQGERLVYDSPSEAVLLVSLLLIGGYSSAAERLMGQLTHKRKGTSGASARETNLLRLLRHAVYANDNGSITALHGIASEAGASSVQKQLAMVCLFHVYKARKDLDRARTTAGAIWSEAESIRQQLEAMGVRPLVRELALPQPIRSPSREPAAVREKAAALR